MKISTANQRIYDAINADDFVTAAKLLKKYQRMFGHRKFTYWTRCMISNGLWIVSAELKNDLQQVKEIK